MVRVLGGCDAMKRIAAGDTQKKAPKGSVYVVYGVDYECWEVLAVTTSRQLGLLAIASDKTVRKVASRAFDDYRIQRFRLDTVVYQSGFARKVRSL
jgi:hypothetical protein